MGEHTADQMVDHTKVHTNTGDHKEDHIKDKTGNHMVGSRGPNGIPYGGLCKGPYGDHTGDQTRNQTGDHMGEHRGVFN